MKCTLCNEQDAVGSAVVHGTYHKDICKDCMGGKPPISAAHADFARRNDAADHQWEIAQPYTNDGQPSRDFISLYPRQAKRLFNEETLRKYS